MKKALFITRMAMLIALVFISFAACKENLTTAPTDNDLENNWDADDEAVAERSNPNPQAYPPRSKQFGVFQKVWSELWWQHMLDFPCATNPILEDGTYTDSMQTGPVFFLAGNAGGTHVRNLTMQPGKAIFFAILNAYWDNPCPADPNDHPAPGQTMEQYLRQRVNAVLAGATNLSVTLDGVPFVELEKYKILSNMYTDSANPDLANCLDACITGDPQFFMSKGYWIMLKPLSPGAHVLQTHGETASGFSLTETYNITQL